MTDRLYHGSPKNLKKLLKPINKGRHTNDMSLYLTDSVDMAISYALGAQWDKVDPLEVYNFEKQGWDLFYILRSKKTTVGYVYETFAPDDAVLVECFDVKTQTNVPIEQHKMPDVIGAFVTKKDCSISTKHVVNYDFIKKNARYANVLVLKKGKHFKKATEKINRLAYQAQKTTDKKELDKKTKLLNKLLDKYTEK